ncbi:restriction endonuclease subunit S [Streptomyces spectabilis]|nr:restriction endonuclease subunit S [Streptomyces spectabilis]
MSYFQELRRHEVRAGDLLIAGLGDDRHPVGRACIAPDRLGPAIVKADCYRVRLDENRLTHRFAAWALGSSAVADQLSASTRGSTRSRINLEVAREIRLPLPPVEQQHRIADFLDAETYRIDAILALRERQISLIGEAAITRAFDAVAGRDVKGDRKDSGLRWLGTVPSDWRITAVTHLFEVELGKMLNQERTTGVYLRPYLRVANVQWDEIDVQDLAMMDFPPDEQQRYKLSKGDLLVCEGGSWPGRAAVWDGQVEEIYYQKALHRIRARCADLSRWLYYCLLVAEKLRVFAVQGNSSTMTHLTREQLRPQRFPFPDVATQKAAVERLDRAAARDRSVKCLLQKQQNVMVERRQALITAAVTGQIDVSTASGREIEE